MLISVNSDVLTLKVCKKQLHKLSMCYLPSHIITFAREGWFGTQNLVKNEPRFQVDLKIVSEVIFVEKLKSCFFFSTKGNIKLSHLNFVTRQTFRSFSVKKPIVTVDILMQYRHLALSTYHFKAIINLGL